MFDVTHPRADLLIDEIKSRFGYDAERGRLKSRGREVGWRHKRTGYRYISIDGNHYKEHRLIWVHQMGEWPQSQIDHINGDKTDNRIENLRIVSGSDNQLLIQKPNANNSCGFRGVTFCQDKRKYSAATKKGGKRIHIGYFDTPDEASAAYQAVKAQLIEVS